MSEKERGLRWKRASRLSDSCLLERQRARGRGEGDGGVEVVGGGGKEEATESLGWQEKKKLFFHRFLFRKNNLSGRRSPFNDLQLHADNSSPAFRFIPSP